ncbi:MAG: hypothetical protein ABF479_10535 [Gluconacetobacter sp.]
MSARSRRNSKKIWFRFGGCTVTITRGNHLRIDHPDLPGPIFTASTPSDWRAERNLRALLRRRLREANRSDHLLKDHGV